MQQMSVVLHIHWCNAIMLVLKIFLYYYIFDNIFFLFFFSCKSQTNQKREIYFSLQQERASRHKLCTTANAKACNH